MSGPRHARRPDGERGSHSLELAVLAPGMILILTMIIVAGRYAVVHQAIEGAASQAARAASLARDPIAAADRAQEVAAATLSNAGLHCASVDVSVDTSGFAVPVGTPASVSATVTCVVDIAGFSVPGIGPQTLTTSHSSALDTFRER